MQTPGDLPGVTLAKGSCPHSDCNSHLHTPPCFYLGKPKLVGLFASVSSEERQKCSENFSVLIQFTLQYLRCMVGMAGLARGLLTPEPHLLDPEEQGGRFNAQQLGGAVRAFDFPAGFVERRQHVLAFALSQFDFGEDFGLGFRRGGLGRG